MGFLRACIGGRDPDDIFGYYSVKMVKVRRPSLPSSFIPLIMATNGVLHYFFNQVRDRRLGLLKYFLYLVIFIYVVIVQLFMNQTYLFQAAPIGTVRFSIRIPSNPKCQVPAFKVEESCSMVEPEKTGGCCSLIPPASTLQYCEGFSGDTDIPDNNREKCIIWDGISAKKAEQDSLLITTHVGIQRGQTAVAEPDGDPHPPSTWSPPEIWKNHGDMVKRFIAGVEDFTVNVEHTIFAKTVHREHQFTRPQMQGGRLLVGGEANTFVDRTGLCKRKFATSDSFGRNPHPTGEPPCYILPDSWTEMCDDACKKGTICDEGGHVTGSPDDPDVIKAGLRPCYFDIFKLRTLLDSGNVDLDTPNLCAVGGCLADNQLGAPSTRQP